jgi:hypothetical protein
MIIKRWGQLKESERRAKDEERRAVCVVPTQKNPHSDFTIAELHEIEDDSSGHTPQRGEGTRDNLESVHLEDVEGALDVLRTHFAKKQKLDVEWLERMPTALFATTTLSGQSPDKERIVKQFLEDRTLWTPALQHSIQSLESFVDCLFS